MNEMEMLKKKIEALELDVKLKEKYIETLENRFGKLKEKYKKLYDFAEILCKINDKQEEQIKELVKVNQEIVDVNKKMGKAVKEDVELMLCIINR